MKHRTLNTLVEYCEMFGVNKQVAIQKTKEAIAHYGKNRPARWIEEAREEWYDLLDRENEAKYSLYDAEWYFCELLACYDVYSSSYINLLTKLKLGVNSILDLGCGLGSTSADLVESLNAPVACTNLVGTKQFEFCKRNLTQVFGCHRDAGNTDLVFASEYFEHIYNAGDHLLDVLRFNNPRVLVMANAFNAKSLGHFTFFYNGKWASKAFPLDSWVEAKDMGRLFSQILKVSGYMKMDTGFWNSRPNVYIKK